MNNLTQFISSMLALSIGVERIVEILKGMIQPLRDDPNPNDDLTGTLAARRRAILQVLAAAFGTLIALIVDPHCFISSLPTGADFGPPTRWVSSILIGLMTSGGSAFWNHALDIIAAVKNVKEQVAANSSLPQALPQPTPVQSASWTQTWTQMPAAALSEFRRGP